MTVPPGGFEMRPAEISLNEMWFSTLNYQPPHYTRSVAYEDTVASAGEGITARRNVTDLGPTLGIWAPFTILCYNKDNYNNEVPFRGQHVYDQVMHLFRDLIGVPFRLVERQTDFRYYVMFGQDGVTQKLIQPQDIDLYGNPKGNEFELTISLIEVTPDDA